MSRKEKISRLSAFLSLVVEIEREREVLVEGFLVPPSGGADVEPVSGETVRALADDHEAVPGVAPSHAPGIGFRTVEIAGLAALGAVHVAADGDILVLRELHFLELLKGNEIICHNGGFLWD